MDVVQSDTPGAKSVMLWLCVWGEAANLRFCPEFCATYHCLAAQAPGKYDLGERWYLHQVVRPVYKSPAAQQSKEWRKNHDHPEVCNYDDLNDLFGEYAVVTPFLNRLVEDPGNIAGPCGALGPLECR